MYCEAMNESVLQETNPSRDELYACMMMGCEEGSERIEWRNKGKAGKTDRKETECSSSQPSSQAGDTPFEGRPRTEDKEKMGFLLQKLYDDRRWHDDHFNPRPDLGQRIPGKNLTREADKSYRCSLGSPLGLLTRALPPGLRAWSTLQKDGLGYDCFWLEPSPTAVHLRLLHRQLHERHTWACLLSGVWFEWPDCDAQQGKC